MSFGGGGGEFNFCGEYPAGGEIRKISPEKSLERIAYILELHGPELDSDGKKELQKLSKEIQEVSGDLRAIKQVLTQYGLKKPV